MASATGIARTPDSAFLNLLDYPFEPHYIELSNPGDIGDGVTKLRLHFIDEGQPSNSEVILLLHGEPSWSYLYRHFVKSLTDYRVIVPDLIGFGKSDKPMRKIDYSYDRHVAWIREFIEQLNLTNITLFCQDWGSLIGLRLVGTEGVGDRFARVIVANGGLPTGDTKLSDAFFRWQEYASQQTKMNVGSVIKMGVIRAMKIEEIDAYNAPFPDENFQAGALVFPELVPTKSDDPSSQKNREAWINLNKYNRPFLTLFSDSDPITAGADKLIQILVPGAANQEHATITEAGHFLQEDKPFEIVQHLIKFIKANPILSG